MKLKSEHSCVISLSVYKIKLGGAQGGKQSRGQLTWGRHEGPRRETQYGEESVKGMAPQLLPADLPASMERQGR